MNNQSNKLDSQSDEVRIPDDVLVHSVVNEINAFFNTDPKTFGKNFLSTEVMQKMHCVVEGRLWSSRETNNDAVEEYYNQQIYLNALTHSTSSSSEYYTVIGLTGSGVASNFFTYYSVEPRLAIFAQFSYTNITQGTLANDGEFFSPSIMGLFSCKKDFDKLIAAIEQKDKWPKEKMLVIQENDRDNIHRCGWLAFQDGSKPDMKWLRNNPTSVATAFIELSKLLKE